LPNIYNNHEKVKNKETIKWMIENMGGIIDNSDQTNANFIVFENKKILRAHSDTGDSGECFLVNKKFVIGKKVFLINLDAFTCFIRPNPRKYCPALIG
jgi:hypothetical protein